MHAQITIHSSQFPENVQRDLLESLRTRRVAHKFHYDSIKQTQRWLALHSAWSPSRNDPACAAAYDAAFGSAVALIPTGPAHLVGLGCGGGLKDARLLRLLQGAGHELFYTPADVSSAMVLVARQAALQCLPAERCFPLVCDFAGADVAEAIGQERVPRLITFFGMIPNFEPGEVLRILRQTLRPGDVLLVSANLAPGPDYTEGMRTVLPQYANPPTCEWLMTFLLDLGVDPGDGILEFTIEEDSAGSGLRRIQATFRFERARRVTVFGEEFRFECGERIRLFYSYRYTAERLSRLLAPLGMKERAAHITPSGEEGVFVFAL